MAKQNGEDLDRYVVVGLEQEIQSLQARLGELRARLEYHRKRAGITHVPMQTASKPLKKRKLSAAGRKAISDAAKARWAREKAKKKR